LTKGFLFAILKETNKKYDQQEVFMTIQQAAHRILTELKEPRKSKNLARIALERGLVSSNAKDPVQSLAATLEKNIRGVYNNPKLIFIYSTQGRLIGLPSWENDALTKGTTSASSTREITARIPVELHDQIQLAAQAGLWNTFDDTVASLLKLGLSKVTADIEDKIRQQLNKLKSSAES
jgi:hypothetical protein